MRGACFRRSPRGRQQLRSRGRSRPRAATSAIVSNPLKFFPPVQLAFDKRATERQQSLYRAKDVPEVPRDVFHEATLEVGHAPAA
jgi:hypothetical protein